MVFGTRAKIYEGGKSSPTKKKHKNRKQKPRQKQLHDPRPLIETALAYQQSAIPQTYTQCPKFVMSGLRPYQLTGLNWLISLKDRKIGGVLADDMGMGKTRQLVSYMGHCKDAKSKKPCLVVAPLSVLKTWQDEFAATCPSINVSTVHGPHLDEMVKKFVKTPKGVLLTTPAYVRIHAKRLNKVQWCSVIVDEVDYIKCQGRTTEILQKLNAETKLIASATPMQVSQHTN